MAKKKVVEDGIEEIVVSQDEYTNEFRVYSDGVEFKSFETVEEAQAEVKESGGTVSVASVK